MHSFVRFIFTIVVVGVVVNLTVVFLANARSESRQARQNRDNQEVLRELLENRFDRRLRRADVVVESQRIDHAQKVIETTLLARQYHSAGADQSQPLRIERIVIPGDRLSIYGMTLEFSELFAEDAPEFKIMRGKKLAYFGVACGEEEKPPPGADERFTFLPRGMVAEMTRIDSDSHTPTLYETALWRYIWEKVPGERHDLPWNSSWNNSLNTVLMKPATAKMRLQHWYVAWISPDESDGALSIEEDPRGGEGLTKLMSDQMKVQEELDRRGGVVR